ncbi:PAS domain S-box protein, partial [Sneathiella sp.]|uniref:PAS domain-containing protein n=1 Tax=Sneathiella sp. TaxID=1964365 RepID=UPI0039E581CC
MATPSDKENMSLQQRSRTRDAILAIISEPACILDNDGTVLSQNERWMADFPSNAQVKPSLVDILDAHSHASILRFLHAPAQTTLELVEARIKSGSQQNVPALIKCVCVEGTFILSIRTSEASSHADVNTAEHLFNSLLLDVIPAPVFCKNKDHIYTAVNDDFAKILGLTREEVIGRNVYDVAPSRNADIYRQADEELFKNGGRQIYETTIKYFDGSSHDVVFHKSIFYGPDNEPAGLIGIILDITDRKKAEDELKENQELLQAIIDNCPSYIFVKDLEGKYIVAGNKFTQRIGWPNGYLLGKTDYELFPDEIASVLRENDQKVLVQKKAISEQESFNFDNVEITNLAVKFPLFDANGALKGVAGIATDISALLKAEERLKNASLELEKQVKERTRELSEEIKVRKLAEAELTQTEAELRNLLSSSPVGVGIYNISDTKFIFSNKALLELFRLTTEEILQSHPEEFWKTPSKRVDLLKEFQKTGEVLNQEVEFKRKDGSCFIGLLSWKKLYLDGDHRLVVWV